jgi:molybdate transport system substrate-binding protein
MGPDDAIVARPAFKIVVTQAVQSAITDIQPLLSHQAGVPVTIEFGQTAGLVDRLLGGERDPIAILTKPSVQQLAVKGLVKSQTDLAVSWVGIAVPDDAPAPRLETTADFVTFLKAIPSIAYPARGASGIYLTQLIEKLGLTDVMKPKTTLVPGGTTASLLREGKVAAAVQQISELKMAGARNIVPLPQEIQLTSVITVAVLDDKAAGDAAARILNALTLPEATAAYERSGLSAPTR